MKTIKSYEDKVYKCKRIYEGRSQRVRESVGSAVVYICFMVLWIKNTSGIRWVFVKVYLS